MRVLAVLLLLMQLGGAAWAAEAPPFDETAAQAVRERMDGDRRVQEVFALCPADAFGRDAPFLSGWFNPRSEDPDLCGALPDACYRRCLQADSRACFGLGRAFQLHDSDNGTTRHAEMMFAMACDAGMGSGCTNRASGLRNADLPNEPLRGLSKAAKASCEFRSFHIGCGQGDAWSCAMEGQAVRLGEGTAADSARARALLQKSCDISPRFVACDFARGQLEEISRPPDGK